jgi:hypothetical protein
MKPHTFKGRTKSAAESGRLSPAEHFLERIKTLTTELEAVQADIYGQASDPAEMLERRMMLEHAATAQVLHEFRAALDRIRNMLWLCTEETSADPDNRQKRHQLARAGALLRNLSPGAHTEAGTLPRQTREAVSFFDRLDRVIDSYMQEGGAIVDRDPGKPSKRKID